MKIKKSVLALTAAAVLLIAGYALYRSGTIGIAEDQINCEQSKTVSWEEQEYDIVGASDGESLYVGVLYRKDLSDAKYFLYVKRSGLSFGWHFLRSGSLSESDGVRAFDCGAYGTAYVSLNGSGAVQKIEFEDGRTPAVTEPAGKIICERSKSAVRFYDANGEEVAYSRLTALEG